MTLRRLPPEPTGTSFPLPVQAQPRSLDALQVGAKLRGLLVPGALHQPLDRGDQFIQPPPELSVMVSGADWRHKPGRLADGATPASSRWR